MKPASRAEQAIRELVAAQVAAWNAGDGRAYARRFAAKGSFTNIYGCSYAGHDAFEQRHVEIFASFFKGSGLTATVRRLRFVTPEVCVVELDTELRGVGQMPPGGPPVANGVLNTRLMQIYVLRDDGWWIEAHHNVAVHQPSI
jgi:uncharacterized protein (TIGR02246 family)